MPVSLREMFRHQLEDGAVAQPHQHRASERADRERDHGRPRQEQREQRDAAEHPREDLGAADPVGQPSADGPHERREHDESSGSEAGVGGSQAELRPQQRRQVDRERDEAAEGEEVEGAEQPGGRLAAQHRGHRGNRGGTHGLRRIPRQQEIRDRPSDEHCARTLEHRFPAKAGRHYRADEDGHRLPHRPQSVHAEGRALPGRRCPSGNEGGAHREGRSGHADQERRHEQRGVAVSQRNGEGSQRGKDEERREHQASAEAIRQHAHRQPRQRAQQHRHRHQQRGLRRRQLVEAGEDRREPADETPRDERDGERDRREDEGAGRRPGRAGHSAARGHALEGSVAHVVPWSDTTAVRLQKPAAYQWSVARCALRHLRAALFHVRRSLEHIAPIKMPAGISGSAGTG